MTQPQQHPALSEAVTNREGALIGLWVCSGNALTAEIVAGSGCDWVLIDGEHSPNDLRSTLEQMLAVGAYSAVPVVRVSQGDPVRLNQYLDIGVQNILVPMVDTPEQAQHLAAAVDYPPKGERGVGAYLTRAGRWGRVPGYVQNARKSINLIVQIESALAVENAADIVAVDGVDAVFIGPADLAASMGYPGQTDHPEVKAAIASVIEIVKAAGKPVGINAFNPEVADSYIAAGIDFITVESDVTILARQTEAMVQRFR